MKRLSACVIVGLATILTAGSVAGQSTEKLVVWGDLTYFFGPGKPLTCTMQNRYKRGEPVGFRATAINPTTNVRDKGTKRFQRAMMVAGLMIAGAYLGIYMPPQKKASELQAKIDKARQLMTFGEQYVSLRNQLSLAYSGLPSTSDREQWLSNSVRDSLNASSLLTEDFKPVRELESNGLISQASSVALTLRFAEFYDWLLRIESAKPLMHVQVIELRKKQDQIGKNGATCEIATVIPKQRFN